MSGPPAAAHSSGDGEAVVVALPRRSIDEGLVSVDRPAVPVGPRPTSAVADQPEAVRTADLRVVVIDDRHDRRQLMRHVVELSNQPATVVGFADSPSSAVTAVDLLGAQAVILEIQIPISQGLATVSALRHGHPSLRIIVCSFHNDPATRDAAMARGADAYITKPFSPRDLYSLMRSA